MEKFTVTIARGYGSGGRTIGKMLAQKLGVKFYDKELIRMASDASGINEALFGQSDEKTKNGVFNKPGVYKGEVIAPGKSGFISEENLFNYQAMVIKKIASEESCVKNAAEVKGITDRKEALKIISATDRERAAYYKAHTGREWIDARNYDLCLNSGDLGFEKCVDIITDFIKTKLG